MELVQLEKPVEISTHYWHAGRPLRVTEEHAELLCSMHGAKRLKMDDYDISETGVVTKKEKVRERAVTRRPEKAETPEDKTNG